MALFDFSAGVFQLLSLWVEEPYRKAGLGLALLQASESAAEKAGCARLKTVYRSTLPDRVAFEKTLCAAGWQPPALRMLVLETSYERMMASPVMQNPPPLGEGFTLLPWSEVPAEAIEAAAAKRCFHKEVWPPNYGENYHRETSFGVLFGGELVGWIVNHPTSDPAVLRFTTSYLRDDLQRRGRFASVIAESVRRTRPSGKERAIWTVPVFFPRMLSFARRRLAPFCDRVSETFGVEKILGHQEIKERL